MSTSLTARRAIQEMIAGRDLDRETTRTVMNEIMTGYVNEIQISAFLATLAMKGETIEEITALAEVTREHARKFSPTFDVMDIVGTGGDGRGTINISTTACLVVAAGGVPIAKHGNRAVSSKSGAADLLEKLGVNINVPPHISLEWLKHYHFCFLFAQNYHPASKADAAVRRVLGMRTVFNILGPLANPANANRELMGVYSEKLVEPLAQVLKNLGVKRGMTVFGFDGLDEATITDKTKICEVHEDGTFETRIIQPEDFGIPRASLKDLEGGDAETNARITRAILSGKETGPKRDVVALNAGLALYLSGKVSTIADGVALAFSIIADGSAEKLLSEMVHETHKFESNYDFV